MEDQPRAIIEGNYEDKYHSKNPIAKFLVRRFIASFEKLLALVKQKDRIEKICEVGCGEGELLKRLRRVFPDEKIFACDISPRILEKAKRNCSGLKINFSVQDAEKLTLYQDNSFDLVVCCEVLEHLKNPLAGLKEIRRITKKYAIISVPVEPLWRFLNIIRGKYLKDLGNTPGHLNHWSILSMQKLIKKSGFKIRKRLFPLPWQFFLIEKY